MCWWSVGVVPASAEHTIASLVICRISELWWSVGDVPASENTYDGISWEQHPYIAHLRGVSCLPFGRYGKVCPASMLAWVTLEDMV